MAFLLCFGFIFWACSWLPGQILNASRNLLAYIAILLSGLVIYLVARWVQRRRGVDLDAAYREIPIE